MAARRLRQWGRVAAAIARRPRLWPVAMRQIVRLAPHGWWQRPPFLPIPSGDYLAFRLVTQYGDEHHAPAPDDVVNYLSWCARAGS